MVRAEQQRLVGAGQGFIEALQVSQADPLVDPGRRHIRFERNDLVQAGEGLLELLGDREVLGLDHQFGDLPDQIGLALRLQHTSSMSRSASAKAASRSTRTRVSQTLTLGLTGWGNGGSRLIRCLR